jgi:hypothetical protein
MKEQRTPPAHPVEWHFAIFRDFHWSQCAVFSKSWFEARQKAAAFFGCHPDELVEVKP